MTQPAPVPPQPPPPAPPQPAMTVYDRQGNALELPADQAAAALQSGDYGLPKGRVQVMAPDGTLGSVPSEHVATALQQGYRPPTSEDLRQADLQKKYGGIGGQLETAALGLGSGATFGLTDLAAKGLGVDVGGRYEANPTTALASKVGGAVLPALATGGASAEATGAELAAEGAEAAQAVQAASAAETGGGLLATVGKVATAPMRAVTGAGGAVERAVTNLIGEGAEGSIITKLAKAAAAKGAGLGTEGAIYGMADQINEDVLGDHELNAEKILSSGIHGALLGAATGGLLSSVGELGQYTLGKLAPKIGSMSEEMAARATGARTTSIREMNRIPGGAKAVGKELLDSDLIKAGDTLEDLAPRLNKARQEAGQEVTNILSRADEAGHAGPQLGQLREDIEKKVIRKLEALPKTNASSIKAARTVLEDLEIYAGVPSEELAAQHGIDRAVIADSQRVTFQGMQDFRGRLGERINWDKMAPKDSVNETLKDVYKILETSVENEGEKAASALGGSFKEEYQDAKLRFRRLAAADDAAKSELDRKAARNIAAPSDKGIGIGAMAGMLAHGAGGPLAIASGIGSAAIHHFARERTATTAAVLLDKLSALRGVERAAQTVDQQIDRGIAGMMGQAKADVVPRKPHGFDTYADRVKAVQAAAGNIEAHANRAATIAAPIAQHAPKTAQAVQTAALRAVQYLASQVPKRQPPPSITPQFDKKFVAPEQEQKDFNRKFDAVADPAAAIASGKLTRGEVEAIKATKPKMYVEMIQKAQARLADTKHPMTYEQKLNMGLLLGIPADATMAADFVAAMQATYGPPAPPQGGNGGGPAPAQAPHRNTIGSHPLESAKQNALPIGRLEA